MMTFEVLAIIVFLNVMATIALWRQAARKPEKLNKKFRNALLHSAPITPNHQPPNKIGESAPSLVRLQDLLFFDDFRDFGDVVNCWLGDEHVGGPCVSKNCRIPTSVSTLQICPTLVVVTLFSTIRWILARSKFHRIIATALKNLWSILKLV